MLFGPSAVQFLMSLFSRLFRKAPSLSPAPSSATSALSEKSTAAVSRPGVAERALASAAEEKSLQSAIEARDFEAVARWVVAGSSTKVRQAAAQAIEDPERLRKLIREVRGGNDKSVYKILTTKRDARIEEVRQQEQLRAEIDAASEALERHSRSAYDSSYGPRLDQFENRWEAVAAQASPELRGRVETSIARARSTIAEYQRQLAEQASRERAAAEAAAVAGRLRDEQMQALAAADAEQAGLLADEQRERAEKQEAEQQALRQIGELIRKARAALGDGSSSRAAGVRRTIEEKLAAAPPLTAQLASQLQQLDQKLEELKDWKDFSVTPKRAELIEEMESLIGSSLEPLALAEKIRHLRDEWRTLGRGAGENVEADEQRFQQAAQQAHAPCDAYFAAQALIRAENLRRREALLVKLSAFESETDWERPDWQAVIKTLRDTKQEWRGISPIDHQAGRQQEKSFAALCASLRARLDAEHARNVKQKESLIERARQALVGDEGRKAIEVIKTLQKQWQAVGPVPREVDQRLWGEFRQQCDAVFQKREQESAAHTAGIESNKAQAVALCEQVEKIARLEGAELLAAMTTLSDIRKAFETLGEFPRADTAVLQRRFERGLEQCKQADTRQKAREAESAWAHLFEAANHVRAYRLAVARGAGAEQIDALKEAAEAHIASVQRWPKGGADAIRTALADKPDVDLASNEAALKMLCIRAEILTDRPTPSEDLALRRDYQLQRLVQGMGQRPRIDESQLDALALDWVRVGPVEEAPYVALQRRFLSCRERGNSSVEGRS